MSKIEDPCRVLGGRSSPHRVQVGCPGLSPTPSSLAGAQDAGKATCLMLAWPGGSASSWSAPRSDRPCRERGRENGEHLNGILLSILRAAASATPALMRLLSRRVRPENGQAELSPSRRGLCPPPPRAPSPGGWRPCLGLPLALARVLSCHACLLWSGEKRGVTSEEGEDYPAFLEHFTFLPALADV